MPPSGQHKTASILRSLPIDLPREDFEMRTLLFIGQGLLLAFVVFVMPACHGDSKTVKIKRGQPIEIRVLLSDTVVPSVSSVIQTSIEIAIEDFGPINGYQLSIETLDEMCSGGGGRAAAETVVADAQVVGVIGVFQGSCRILCVTCPNLNFT